MEKEVLTPNEQIEMVQKALLHHMLTGGQVWTCVGGIYEQVPSVALVVISNKTELFTAVLLPESLYAMRVEVKHNMLLLGEMVSGAIFPLHEKVCDRVSAMEQRGYFDYVVKTYQVNTTFCSTDHITTKA